MIGGVNFQPGLQDQMQPNGQPRPSGGGGVQEAIKILSLRLPRVLGAQAAAPMPLLTSQGSGGNPRIDSVVNQVLSRMMAQQPQGQPPMPVLGGSGQERSTTMPLPRAPFAPSQPSAPPPQLPDFRSPYGKTPNFEFEQNPPVQPPGPDPRVGWGETPFPDPLEQERSQRPFTL